MFYHPSIHESILLRKGKDTDFDTLREMVKEVNRTQLLPTEILSDEVYQYSRDTQTLSRVVASQEEFLMPDKVEVWKRCMPMDIHGMACFRLRRKGH